MPITSKNISTNDLQLYLEDDISDDKKRLIFEIENKNNDGKTLTSQETKLINELNILRNVDNFFEKAINNQPPMPKELQNEIDKRLDLAFDNEPSLIQSFLNIKHLISGGIGAFSAIAAMLFYTTIYTSSAYRLVESASTTKGTNLEISNINFPNQWLIKNDIAFALSFKLDEKEINTKEEVRVEIGDTLIFNLIPLKSRKIDIIYISSDGEKTTLYEKEKIQKGKKFLSKDLLIAKPIGTDKIQILENGNVILEKNIIVIE
jgi:hypothetical protein